MSDDILLNKFLDEGVKCPQCNVAMEFLSTVGVQETLYFYCDNCKHFFTIDDDDMKVIKPIRDKTRIGYLRAKYDKPLAKAYTNN